MAASISAQGLLKATPYQMRHCGGLSIACRPTAMVPTCALGREQFGETVREGNYHRDSLQHALHCEVYLLYQIDVCGHLATGGFSRGFPDDAACLFRTLIRLDKDAPIRILIEYLG